MADRPLATTADEDTEEGPGPLRRLLSTDPIDLVPRLTLLVALPHEMVDTPVLVVVVVATVVCIAWPRALHNPLPYLALAALRFAHQLSAWEGIDNHYFLVSYWVLAVGIAMCCTDPRLALRRSAQLTIGVVFALAAAWKVLAGDFLDGRFFRFTLLVDPRLTDTTVAATDLTQADITANQAAFETLRQPLGEESVATLRSTAAVRPLALAMAWWGFIVESALAVAYLAPLRERWAWVRTALLIGFCLGTYVVIPVSHFGAVLVTMGLAVAPPRHRPALLVTLAIVLAAPFLGLT